MNRYRPRKEVKMWLYTDKPEENKLVEYVGYLKKTRQLAKMVRDGLRLIWTLGEGDMSFLFQLFPHLEAQLANHFAPPAPPDSGDMQRQIELAVAAGVEKAMQNFPALPAGRMVAEPAYKEVGKGIGTIGQGRVIAAPVFDDDDDQDTVLITKAAISGNSDTAFAAMIKIAF